ncbi:MAG: ABC transporter ATP-binding protein [Lachnospiraceae bacterium]|nr:ABC transporter ATP-binding protein [Lachnospiraceae bacterium]
MVVAEHIKKNFGVKRVLSDVTFSLKEGDILGIVGANGCGKSTLLGILAGTLPADGGSLSYDGKNAFSSRKVFSDGVGFIPQENPLMMELSVLDNLRLWYDASAKELMESMEQGPLKQWKLYEYAKVRASRLSGGTKKRLSIACALSSSPKVLILDEPGAALDLSMKEEIKSVMKEFAKDHKAVILTSHEMSELSICNRLMLLKDGSLKELSLPLDEAQLLSLIGGKE